jgi:LPXTG-motif cell wall-anchored protein
LAFTGLGKNGKLIALLGAMLVLMGLVLFFIDVRKVAHWFLGL